MLLLQFAQCFTVIIPVIVSLQDEETASLWGQYTSNMQKHWTCVVCGQEMLVTLAERLEHELVCQADTKGKILV